MFPLRVAGPETIRSTTGKLEEAVALIRKGASPYVLVVIAEKEIV
jgi:hypothetical protein